MPWTDDCAPARRADASGRFLDPLADKLLLVVTYITFSYLNWIPLWVFVAVISRDLLSFWAGRSSTS